MSDLTPEQAKAAQSAADLKIKEAQEDLIRTQIKEMTGKISREDKEAQLPFWRKPGAVNTGLSVFAAIIAAYGGVMSHKTAEQAQEADARAQAANSAIEAAKIDLETTKQAIDASESKLKNVAQVIANQTATQEGSYRYVKEIMDRMQRMELLHEKIQKGEKSLEMRTILPSLKIITEASTSKNRESAEATRGFILVKLALLMGQHHEAAGLDPTLDHVNEWKKFAATDTDATRATAIMALSTIGRLAIAENEEPLFKKVVDAIRKIDFMVFKKEKDNLLHLNEIANAKFALYEYGRLAYRPGLSPLVSFISDWKESEESNTVMGWENSLDEAMKLNAELTKQIGKDPTQKTPRTDAVSIETQRLANSVKKESKLADYVKTFASKTPETGNKSATEAKEEAARELAILGTSAVTPLAEKLSMATDSQLRLEILNILRQMPQPLLMEGKAVDLVIQRLGDSDKNVRIAAAEFLMGCWHTETVNLIYVKLSSKVETILLEPSNESKVIPVPADAGIDPKFVNGDNTAVENGLFVHHGGLIIGTWARTLRDTIEGPKSEQNPGGAMNAIALAKVTAWRDTLKGKSSSPGGSTSDVPKKTSQASAPGKWDATVKMFDDLITRAVTRRDLLAKQRELAKLEKIAADDAANATQK